MLFINVAQMSAQFAINGRNDFKCGMVGLNMELHLSCINPFHGIDLFLYPLKTSNTSGFLMISGGIEMEYCCLK